MMDDNIKKQILNNNIEIEKLLEENEQLLRQAGYEPPVKNYALEGKD